jgi:hypothetical protein
MKSDKPELDYDINSDAVCTIEGMGGNRSSGKNSLNLLCLK